MIHVDESDPVGGKQFNYKLKYIYEVIVINTSFKHLHIFLTAVIPNSK